MTPVCRLEQSKLSAQWFLVSVSSSPISEPISLGQTLIWLSKPPSSCFRPGNFRFSHELLKEGVVIFYPAWYDAISSAYLDSGIPSIDLTIIVILHISNPFLQSCFQQSPWILLLSATYSLYFWLMICRTPQSCFQHWQLTALHRVWVAIRIL